MHLPKPILTLFKGLLLFVLVTSPATTFSHVDSIGGSNSVVQNTTNVSKKFTNIPVSASDTVSSSEKHHYSSSSCQSDFHKALLDEINKYREVNDISFATLDGQLSSAACAHSEWMNQNSILDHIGYDNTNFGKRCIRAETACNAENILLIQTTNPKTIFETLKNDDANIANLLDPDNKNIGFGLENGYLTILFR
jgi:uncharacterized protein YkwD